MSVFKYPSWNDPPEAAFQKTKKKVNIISRTDAVKSPMPQNFPEPTMMGPGSNPGMPLQSQMNYGYYDPQQNYYSGGIVTSSNAPKSHNEQSTQMGLGSNPEMTQPKQMNYECQRSHQNNSEIGRSQSTVQAEPANLMNTYQQLDSQPQNPGFSGGPQPQPMRYQLPQHIDQQHLKLENPETQKYAQKRSIPAEHQILQEVFDGLKNKCLAASNHPQNHRKLEDVGKKLEVLYEKLRNQSLTPHVTTGLHQLILFIWAFDYKRCLQVINHMVSGGSFALLVEFLPGIKVLIQIASQLGVYVKRPQ